jgi:hypothetical protein
VDVQRLCSPGLATARAIYTVEADYQAITAAGVPIKYADAAAWTAKEAILKLRGTGLGEDPLQHRLSCVDRTSGVSDAVCVRGRRFRRHALAIAVPASTGCAAEPRLLDGGHGSASPGLPSVGQEWWHLHSRIAGHRTEGRVTS